MKKNKILLPVYLCLSLLIIIGAVVMSLTVGVNLGIDFNGGKQVEIKLAENANEASYTKDIDSVLKNYGLKVDSSVTQDKYSDAYYVFKINETDISDADATAIREDIAEKLGIGIENISEMKSVSGNVTQKTLITVSIAVACVLLVIFAAAWIRYGIMEGLSLLFVGLHNMILGFAMVLVTTLQLNIPTIIAILVCSLLSVAGYTLVLESVREAKNSSQNKECNDFDLYNKANKKALSNSLILVIALAVIAVACLFSQMYFVKLFAFALIACLFVSVYSAHAVGTTLGAALSNIATVSSKQKLSKNVETKPEPKKTTKKK